MFKIFSSPSTNPDETPDGEDSNSPNFHHMDEHSIAICIAKGSEEEDSLVTMKRKSYTLCVKILTKPRERRRDHYCNGIAFVHTLFKLRITNSKLEDFYTYVCNEDLEKLEEVLRLCNSKKLEGSLVLQAIEEKRSLSITKEKIEIEENPKLNPDFVGYSL